MPGMCCRSNIANDLVSIYKHNSVLLKKVGDKVKAGEAIAIVGNSGELTTGPHLHFELWLKGAGDPGLGVRMMARKRY
jgi:murein DD-endopeptidase MepM/ murein hydrolase activator NlpD